MTLHDYLLQHIQHTVMISLAVDGKEPFQYNYWNWLSDSHQLHLLKDDFTIGHILHCGNSGSVVINDDGSIFHTSGYFPKKSLLNFYFGNIK